MARKPPAGAFPVNVYDGISQAIAGLAQGMAYDMPKRMQYETWKWTNHYKAGNLGWGFKGRGGDIQVLVNLRWHPNDNSRRRGEVYGTVVIPGVKNGSFQFWFTDEARAGELAKQLTKAIDSTIWEMSR